MKYRFHTLDVFTSDRFGGNPLAVLTDAADLDGAQMQTIAREFNLSETTFVSPPQDSSNTANVRIFTPGAELPFAGHPTVGTAIVLAHHLENRADVYEREIRLEEKVGLLVVDVTKRAGVPAYARFTSAVLPEVNRPAPDPAVIAKAISLGEDDIGAGTHQPGDQIAGNSFLFVPVRDMAVLARAEVDPIGWREMTAGKGWVGAFVYTLGGENPDAAFRGRMFGPDVGILEDPATGASAATFPGQLLASESLRDGTHKWFVEQGYEMGRPSQIYIEADVSGGALTAIRVGGHAVWVSEGEIDV